MKYSVCKSYLLIKNDSPYYQPSEGQSSCEVCPARKDCQGGTRIFECPKGKYCAENSAPQDCPDNFFSHHEGLAAESECFPCPPGVTCDNTGGYEIKNIPQKISIPSQ